MDKDPNTKFGIRLSPGFIKKIQWGKLP